MSASFVNNCAKIMESILHLSFLLTFVQTSGMLSQNQSHHNIYIHPREVHRKDSRSLKIKLLDVINSGEVKREFMQPKKGWTGTSISNPIDGRVQLFWGMKPLTL